MSAHLNATFAKCKAEGRNAMVSFLTVGYPSIKETIPILLALQAGGTDVFELGLPFSDPIGDGPSIQKSNQIALENGVTVPVVLDLVQKAREAGVHVPIILMGYYNPVLQYGEARMVEEAKRVGVDGFLLIDLPPEEANRFRNVAASAGLSYVPLIAPSTTDERLAVLVPIADSFLYVVSRMGATGTAGGLNKNVASLLTRVRKFSGAKPLVVGFGISTREDYLRVSPVADGVAVGSHLMELIKSTSVEKRPDAVQAFVNQLVGGRKVNIVPRSPIEGEPKVARAAEQAIEEEEQRQQFRELVDRFGEFGGQYVPESLHQCLSLLEKGFSEAIADPEFWAELRSYYPYMGRPSNLHLADRLTERAGGAQIWLKREDLNHTGSHKINNALAQVLVARRLGKTSVIAETGAGQHGVATATVAAKFGLKCTVYMGAEDCRRQALNVFRMKLLGADVVEVTAGTRTLRDACSEALRAWVTRIDDTHYVLGSATGPHPYPTMVRTFQSVIGNETKEQFGKMNGGKLPDAVVACVGGGSNCSGMFAPFLEDKSVRLVGVEAGGEGLDTKKHSATLSAGKTGVLHGAKTYILQNEDGQVQDTHSISAGLDYPGVGPELSFWKDSGRAEFVAATDVEALQGFRMLSESEGIIPAMESSHAVWGAVQLAKTMSPDQHIVICLSGRGDKDVQNVADLLPTYGPQMGWDLRFEK